MGRGALTGLVGLGGLAGLSVLVGTAWLPAGASQDHPKTAAPHQATHRSEHKTPTQVGQADLLTLADMPAGWVPTTKAGRPTATAPLSTRLAACIEVPSKVATVKPIKVSSPDYSSADRTEAVEDSASVYATGSEAAAAYRAMASPKAPGCMARLGAAALRTSIQQEAGSEATVGTITISALPAGTVRSSGQTGFTVHIPLTSEGRALTITSTQIDTRHGRVLQQLTFNGNGKSFDAAEQAHLLQLVTGPA